MGLENGGFAKGAQVEQQRRSEIATIAEKYKMPPEDLVRLQRDTGWNPRDPTGSIHHIEATVNGVKINLVKDDSLSNAGKLGFTASLDGKKIPEQDAKQIYYHLAQAANEAGRANDVAMDEVYDQAHAENRMLNFVDSFKAEGFPQANEETNKLRDRVLGIG